MTTCFTISPDVCSASDKDGSTILSVEKGMLYSAIGLGSLAWTKLTAHPEGLTLEAMVTSVQKDFNGVSNQQIRRDVETLLNQLNQKGIIVETTEGMTNRIGSASQRWTNTGAKWLIKVTVTLLIRLRLSAMAAYFQLVFFDLALKIGGFRSLHSLVKEWPVANKKVAHAEGVPGVCDAVDQAARCYVRHALCLQRSAVTTCLLRSHGVPAQMVIACRRIPFKGHAWVEVDGQVVNDNPRVQTVCNSVLARC